MSIMFTPCIHRQRRRQQDGAGRAGGEERRHEEAQHRPQAEKKPGTADLSPAEEPAFHRHADPDAEDAEEGEQDAGEDAAAGGQVEHLREIAGQPCGHPIPQGPLHHDGEHGEEEAPLRQERRHGEVHAARGALLLPPPGGRRAVALLEAAHGQEPPQGRRPAQRRGQAEHPPPAPHTQDQRRGEVERHCGRAAGHQRVHAALLHPGGGEVSGHQAHHGGPEHGLGHAVDRPHRRHAPHAGAQGQQSVADGGPGEAGEDQPLGAHPVPQRAAPRRR